MTTDVDVLVVGAGACGLAAAISAHDRGMSAAILEKMDRPGGNSALSTGSVPAAGSRFQREAAIDDDPDRFFKDLMSVAPETDDVELVKRLTKVSAETVEWLVDRGRRKAQSCHGVQAHRPFGSEAACAGFAAGTGSRR